jgi:CRISPR system Cascade subunit CasE
MSWLARALIDHELAARHRLTDSYAWHRAAWRAFPGLDGKPRPFLSRLDEKPDGFQLLVLARDHQPVRPDWCPETDWSVKEVRDEFLRHRHYRFDLHANPTRKVKKLGADGAPTKNGRRQPLTEAERQIAWFRRKAGHSGFILLEAPPLTVESRRDHVFRKQDSWGLHTGVRFQGVLEVTDPPQFREAFFRGIGSAKGFGFGLLQLQPIQI